MISVYIIAVIKMRPNTEKMLINIGANEPQINHLKRPTFSFIQKDNFFKTFLAIDLSHQLLETKLSIEQSKLSYNCNT